MIALVVSTAMPALVAGGLAAIAYASHDAGLRKITQLALLTSVVFLWLSGVGVGASVATCAGLSAG